MRVRKMYASVATVLSGLLLATGTALGQVQEEPPMDRDPGMERQDPGMERQDPGMQREDPGMQREDPGLGDPQMEAPTFSDEEVERFADAYISITRIQEDYTAELEGTEDPEEARQLQERANREMVDAIEEHGLTVPEYSDIANALDTDPELRDEVARMIQERR